MKSRVKKIIGVGSLSLILLATYSITFAHNQYNDTNWNHMNQNVNGNFMGDMADYNHGDFNNHMGVRSSKDCFNYSGMYSFEANKDFQEISLEDQKEIINKFISKSDEEYTIAKILKYSDSRYLFLISEGDIFAYELLVNPYSKNVNYNRGSGMMWNTKIHSFYDNESSLRISEKEALKEVEKYLNDKDIEFTVDKDSLEFYGYYKYLIKNDKKIVGYIDVNSSTGELWTVFSNFVEVDID